MKNKDLNSLNSLAAAGRRWVSYPVSFGPNPILFTIQFTIQSCAAHPAGAAAGAGGVLNYMKFCLLFTEKRESNDREPG